MPEVVATAVERVVLETKYEARITAADLRALVGCYVTVAEVTVEERVCGVPVRQIANLDNTETVIMVRWKTVAVTGDYPYVSGKAVPMDGESK